MLSVCIPVYNFNVEALVISLEKQILLLNKEVEIVLIDDASQQEYLSQNEAVFDKHNGIKLTKNIGRSKIRNLFLSYAQYPFLLFLDCDGKLISETFLQDYLSEIDAELVVICGGRKYSDTKPSKNYLLRWNYGVKRESKTAAERQINPNQSFMSNNFVISKSLLAKVKFEEQLTTYGHEDTLFGIELQKAGIKIKHINNPVLNVGLETNSEFLKKTDEALKNLLFISKNEVYKKQLYQDISLLKIHQKIKQYRLKWLLDIGFSISNSIVKWLLINKIQSVFLFSYYKLGKYSKLT